MTGVGVGRGYLHDPEQTARGFVIPDPFTGEAGSRLYRTGDRGVRNVDGTFEWLGRLDGQVKIRGVRIELPEVEAVLATHPHVRQVAVLAEPADIPTHLLAHVVLGLASGSTVEDLRDFACSRLPDVMVPSSFVLAEALPVTSNGKIDRRALAKPPTALPGPTSEGDRAPTSPVERLLATLWHEVLGVEVRSVDEGFFALGGDSLSTIRLVATARRHGLTFTVEQVFAHPTLAALATVATTVAVASADQGIVVGELPLTPIQRLFFAADLPERQHYNMTGLLVLDGSPCRVALAIAVEHLVRHHDALRLRVRCDGEEWGAAIVGVDGPVPYAHVDLSMLPEDEVAAAIEAAADDAQATLDFANGPIVRVVSFDLGGARPGRLLVTVHHLACDAVSWPILLEDLAAVYDQIRCGEAIVLPPKTTSVQTWARRLEEHARAPERARDRAFWRRECSESGARLPRVREGVSQIADVASRVVALDADETTMLVRAVASAGVTIESVLLAALALALTGPTHVDTLLVYLERHGREAFVPEIDVSRTFGWFTAVFPVAIRIAPARNPWATLAAIDRHLADVPDGGIAWGAVVHGDDEECCEVTGIPRALPEISINFLGRVDPPRSARWTIAPESPGREHGHRGTRRTILNVVGRPRRNSWSLRRAPRRTARSRSY